MLKSLGGRPPYRRSSTKAARRFAAALAAPVLLLTAACGSDDSGSSDASVVTVEGKPGQKPEISVPKDAKASDKVVVKTVAKGKGATVEKGDFVRLDFAGETFKGGQDLGNTWAKRPGADPNAPRTQVVQELGQPSQTLPTKVLDSLVGQEVGSRVEVEGTAKALIGKQLNPQAGIKPADGLVWVVDIAAAKKVGKKSEVKGEQAAPEPGMPTVKSEPQKAAVITVPKGEKPPKELKEQVLIKGKGQKIKAGDGLVVQYTGVKWEDGKKFDSSWDHGGATAFQIGTGSVVQGWDKALVGKNVGDRVVMVIPPKLGYGSQPQSPLAKNTLVFSVDIVGTV
ncbi:FKBP-type peptidyl-prolyl cis-trans isomerase [Streptomyces sp. 8N706]|uniref:FKBP-type peptidyl-prolyl cis-trans isomerase n=1 Tax=Streptomyces sp. 8N706 TaxID=3457416 RepID=UPI003FCFD60C